MNPDVMPLAKGLGPVAGTVLRESLRGVALVSIVVWLGNLLLELIDIALLYFNGAAGLPGECTVLAMGAWLIHALYSAKAWKRAFAAGAIAATGVLFAVFGWSQAGAQWPTPVLELSPWLETWTGSLFSMLLSLGSLWLCAIEARGLISGLGVTAELSAGNGWGAGAPVGAESATIESPVRSTHKTIVKSPRGGLGRLAQLLCRIGIVLTVAGTGAYLAWGLSGRDWDWMAEMEKWASIYTVLAWTVLIVVGALIPLKTTRLMSAATGFAWAVLLGVLWMLKGIGALGMFEATANFEKAAGMAGLLVVSVVGILCSVWMARSECDAAWQGSAQADEGAPTAADDQAIDVPPGWDQAGRR